MSTLLLLTFIYQVSAKISESSRGVIAHLPSCATGYVVLCVLWVCLYHYFLGATGAAHGESPNPCAVIHPNLLLFSIEPHSLANEMIAISTPYIEWHFETYDKNPLIQLFCPLSERMLTLELHSQRLLKDEACIGVKLDLPVMASEACSHFRRVQQISNIRKEGGRT